MLLAAFWVFTIANSFHQRTAEAGAKLQFILQPVQPQPPSNYPPGTTIVGQEIILGSAPARVWLEMYVTGWEPDALKTVQAAISATDPELDGGGYAGSAAICDSHPANGGDLAPAMVPCGGTCLNDPSQICADNSDCRTCQGGTRNGLPCDSLPGSCPGGACPPSAGRICVDPHVACRALGGPACGTQEVSRCVHWDGISPNYFPAGYFCSPGFQNQCHPAWGTQGLVCTTVVDTTTLNYRYGFTCSPGEIPQDFHPSYFGTVVLDVPVDAKGTYSIDFDETQTFYLPIWWPRDELPIASIQSALVTVSCGRCCYEVDGANPQCVDDVTANECSGYGAGAVFAPNEVCPQGGGPACPACSLDEHCDDGEFCNGVEVCEANGECGPGQSPCEPYEECEEATASCALRIPAVSNWGLVVLVLTVLIVAKLKRNQVETD